MADSETVRPSPAEPPSSASRPGSDSGEAPGIPAAEKPGKDEREDDARETKRRRNCPKALDKVQELARTDRRHQSHCSSSFTFDTKFNACSPEFTPKFGSFNFCGEGNDGKATGGTEIDDGLDFDRLTLMGIRSGGSWID
ncbi:hypothetical protein NL676_017078 [Syzygium grande]|nr:hypothetical protein NL676_017078 [Syzygium grande]